MSSYVAAIEATGAVIHVVESFGDYQGTTWAKITHNGITGWVSWGFGSCSGCDSYEHWSWDLRCRLDLDFDDDIPKDELARFGQDYVSDIMSQEAAEAAASKDDDWDGEAAKVLEFLRTNALAESAEA